MKKDIHPKYNSEATMTCACGNSFITGSTVAEIKTELCAACHPFYTGKQKLIDTARRVEKFTTKKSLAQTDIRSKKEKLVAKADAKAARKTEKK
ncbi:MAG: 50S ribosomal protein L31 [bacterium]